MQRIQIPEEQRFYLERIAYYEHEIRSVRLLTKTLRIRNNLDSGYCLRIESAIVGASHMLDAMSAAYRVLCDSRNPKKIESARLELRSISVFAPELFHAINVSYAQRRSRDYSQLFSSGNNMPKLYLAETHLSYPATVLAAEALIDWYHSSLSEFWSTLRVPPPIVAIANGEHASFRIPMRNTATFLGEPGNNSPESFQQHYRNTINMTFITLSRWAPVQIRYMGSIGHEVFHRCMYSVDKLDGEFIRLKLQRNLPQLSEGMEKHFEDKAIKVFGSNIWSLRGKRNKLITQLINHFSTRGYTFGIQQPSEIHDRHSVVAQHHATELFCDFFALLFTGPAYVHSSICTLLIGSESYEMQLSELRGSSNRLPLHPPPIVRIMLLLSWLKEFGFSSHATMIRTLYDIPTSQKLNNAGQYSESMAYFSMLVSSRARAVFVELLEILKDSAFATNTGKPVIVTHLKSEENWNTIWNDLVKQICDGRVSPNDMANYSPVDVLNAIWSKLNNNRWETTEPLRMQWRLALRNSAK